MSGGGWVDSGRHKLSENIWFVWSKMPYSIDMEGCHVRGQRTTDGIVNIELESAKQDLQLEILKNEQEKLKCVRGLVFVH